MFKKALACEIRTLCFPVRCTILSGRPNGALSTVRGPAFRAHATGDNLENTLGVHALVFSGSWDRQAAEAAISGAHRAGYDLIEIPLMDPESIDVATTRTLLEEYDLSASASLGLRLDADVSSPDLDIAAQGQVLLRQALHCASGLGASHLCGIIYSALAKYIGPPQPQGRAHAVAALKHIAGEAADLGITLCAEIVNRYETNLLNTAAQGMEFISDVGHPNLKLHLDTYHMHIEEGSMEAAVAIAKSSLGYVHVGESHRGYLGTGSVDFTGFFRALDSVSYSGPITFESFSSKVVSPALSNTLCVWRDPWEDSDDLAVSARNFIQSEMKAARGHGVLAAARRYEGPA